ncbi:MAG: glycosyltransferase, partial [Methanosarcinales archaeon]
MKICYFGSYNRDYPRNKILINGLRKNNVNVTECNFDFPHIITIKDSLSHEYDGIIVGFPGQKTVPFARLISKLKGVNLVFDAFLSVYNTYVFDRKDVKQNSLKGRYYYSLDKISCKLADVVLLDTYQHIKYFLKTFNISQNKFRRIFIGAEDNIFYPRKYKKDGDKFVVEFHGKFIPLQGTNYIIKAAKLLEKDKEIIFNLIGNGKTYEKTFRLAQKLKLKNVNFLGWIVYEKLPFFIANADVGLGIFGNTEKAKMVVPNKAYEILAMKKALITGDSPASREVGLINEKN